MMNKKEAAALADAQDKLAAAMALHWPIEPKPQPADTQEWLKRTEKELFVGWWCNAWKCEFRVGQGCCNSVHHSTSSTTKTDSQNIGRFYHTKEEALLAARWELCEQMAATLAKLDAEYIAALND